MKNLVYRLSVKFPVFLSARASIRHSSRRGNPDGRDRKISYNKIGPPRRLSPPQPETKLCERFFFLLLTAVFQAAGATDKPSHDSFPAAANSETNLPEVVEDLFGRNEISPLSLNADTPDNQTETGGFPEAAMNAIHDTVKKRFYTEQDFQLRNAAYSLQKELEHNILRNSYETPQVTKDLRAKIIQKKTSSHTIIAAARLAEELINNYPHPLPEIIKTLDIFRMVLSREKTNSHVREAVSQSAVEILVRQKLPAEEAVKIYDQIKKDMFHVQFHTAKAARKQTARLLEAGLVPEGSKQEVFADIRDKMFPERGRGGKISAINALSEFERRGLFSDPSDGQPFVWLTADLFKDKSHGIRTAAAGLLHTFLKREIVTARADRKKLISMIADRMDDREWIVQQSAVTAVSDLLISNRVPAEGQVFTESRPPPFSDTALFTIPEQLTLFHTIGDLIFHEQWSVRKAAYRAVRGLWNSDFPHEGKVKIQRRIAENLPSAQEGRRTALKLLRGGRERGIPVDLEVAYSVTALISEPSPLGNRAKNFIQKEVLDGKDPSLSPDERLLLFFEMEQQLSLRKTLKGEPSENCRRALTDGG